MNQEHMVEAEMDIEISHSCEGVVWREVVEVLRAAGLALFERGDEMAQMGFTE